MAKGPRRPRRDRDQAAARRTPAGRRERAKGRAVGLPADTRGPSAKQVARELAKLEERLAEARTNLSKRQRQLEQAAADVASLVSDVARLHAALTAIEIASAPDIAALVDGLDEEVARLDRADAVAPVRRRRRAPVAPPVVEADVAEEPAVAAQPEAVAEPEAAAEPEMAAEPEAVAEPEMAAQPELAAQPEMAAEPEVAAEPAMEAEPEVAAVPEMVAEPEVAEDVLVADVMVVAIVEEEALLEIPEALESEISPGLPADVGEQDALADVEQRQAAVDVAEPEALEEQVVAADEPEGSEEAAAEPEVVAIFEEAVVAEEPEVLADEPAVIEAEPLAPEEEPIVAEEEPIAAAEEPIVAEEEPIAAAEEPIVAEPEPVVAEQEPIAAAEEPPITADEPLAAEETDWAAPAMAAIPSVTTEVPEADDWAAGDDLRFRPSLATFEEAVSAGPVASSTNGSGYAAGASVPDHTLDPSEVVHVAASIDVGSNSIHLLAAVVADHELQPLIDESALLGLGSIVDERGYMSHRRADSLAAIRAYITEARDLHAADVTVIGTEPMRRAADSTRLIVELENATGIPIHVVDHVEEALLTLIGVTGGRPVETDLGVVDVGGGSSEIVLISPGRPPIAGGLRVGSARLTTSIVRHDPPTEAEIAQLRAEARHRIASAPPGSPELLIAVGGTATNLLRVLPGTALDRILTRRRLASAMEVLATEPAEEASRRHAVSLMRARILPAGAAIMEALLERYNLDQLYVSDAGIREGTILAVAHSGPNWRDQLPLLAQGWRH